MQKKKKKLFKPIFCIYELCDFQATAAYNVCTIKFKYVRHLTEIMKMKKLTMKKNANMTSELSGSGSIEVNNIYLQFCKFQQFSERCMTSINCSNDKCLYCHLEFILLAVFMLFQLFIFNLFNHNKLY